MFCSPATSAGSGIRNWHRCRRNSSSRLVCEDLRVLLGVKGQPVFQHCALYPKAIPQYNVGYGKFKDVLNEIEARARGLFFAGHYRDGVSLGDSIVSGVNIAERIGKTF